MIEMKIAQGELLLKVKELRREVFCTEQGYSEQLEFDKKDDEAIHLAMVISGETVAAARVTSEGDDYTVGRICVKKDSRGEGYGRAIVLYAIDKCRREGAKSIGVMSELHAVEFYRALGFEQSGDSYFDGHLERIPMQLDMNRNFSCCGK